MFVQKQEKAKANKYTGLEDATLEAGRPWDACKVPPLKPEGFAGSA